MLQLFPPNVAEYNIGWGLSDWKDPMSSIQIPWQSLSESALNGIIEEFVTREGTEYGDAEVSIESKCRQVRRQLEGGEAIITYNDDDQTCSIVPLDN